jgi:hypothetical protein
MHSIAVAQPHMQAALHEQKQGFLFLPGVLAWVLVA